MFFILSISYFILFYRKTQGQYRIIAQERKISAERCRFPLCGAAHDVSASGVLGIKKCAARPTLTAHFSEFTRPRFPPAPRQAFCGLRRLFLRLCGLFLCRRREGHAADVYINLDHMQAGHRLDLALDIVLHLSCDLADVMTEQREKADLNLYGILLAQLDARTPLDRFFLLRKLTMSRVTLE